MGSVRSRHLQPEKLPLTGPPITLYPPYALLPAGSARSCPLPTACCLLPPACCLLSSASRLLPSAGPRPSQTQKGTLILYEKDLYGALSSFPPPAEGRSELSAVDEEMEPSWANLSSLPGSFLMGCIYHAPPPALSRHFPITGLNYIIFS